MNKLDLRYNSIINDLDLNQKLQEISEKNKKKYFNLINELNNLNSKNLLWISSITSSKNIFLSRIYFYICIKELIDNNLKIIKKYSTILVNDKIVFKLIKHKTKDDNINIIFKNDKSYFILNIKRFFKIISSIFFFKLFIKKKRILNKQTLFQIPISRTYKIENSIGLLKKFSNKNNYNKIIFIPYCVNKNIKEYISLIKLNNNDKVLFKQSYISFCSYLKLFKIYISRNKINFFNNISDFDKKIIDYEYNKNLFDVSSFESIEFYFFLKELSDKSFKLNFLSIFENASINKLWNLSIHNYFKNSINNGLKVMIPVKNYFSQYTILPSEYNLNLLPNKIFLVSDVLKKQLSNDNYFIKHLYFNGPALRIISDNKNKKSKKIKAIFFFTSILNFETEQIIKHLKLIKQNKEFQYFIKFHPSFDRATREKYLKLLPSFFKNNEILKISNLHPDSIILSGMSSVILDSIAFGINTIYFDVGYFLSLNPILNNYSKIKSFHIFRFQNDINKLLFNINNYRSRKVKYDIYNHPNKRNVNQIYR